MGTSLTDMANFLSMTPGYLSALERGVKGKPSRRLLEGLVEYFDLSHLQIEELEKAAEASTTLVKLRNDSDPDIYWVGHLFAKRANSLSKSHLGIIKTLLIDTQEAECKTVLDK